jgi:hypothetical protein
MSMIMIMIKAAFEIISVITSVISPFDQYVKYPPVKIKITIYHIYNSIISIMERNIYLLSIHIMCTRGKTEVIKNRENIINGDSGVC